jgi:hypothetical protein
MTFKYMPFKLILLLGVLAFGVTLAIIIGQRLSTEAMAVLMGVVAGVAASIPTSLIVVWIAMQSMVKQMPAPQPVQRAEPPQPESPRVVVVQQPVAATAPGYAQPVWGNYPNANAYPAMPAPRPPRKFTVIGGTSEPEEVVTLQPLEPDL